MSFSLCVLWDDLPRHFISKKKAGLCCSLQSLLHRFASSSPRPSFSPHPSFASCCSLHPLFSFVWFLFPLVHSQAHLPESSFIFLLCLPLSACILESLPLSAAGNVGHVAGRSSLISPPFFSLCGTYESSCNKSEELCNDFECFASRFIKHEALGFVCVCVCLLASKIHA